MHPKRRLGFFRNIATMPDKRELSFRGATEHEIRQVLKITSCVEVGDDMELSVNAGAIVPFQDEMPSPHASPPPTGTTRFSRSSSAGSLHSRTPQPTRTTRFNRTSSAESLLSMTSSMDLAVRGARIFLNCRVCVTLLSNTLRAQPATCLMHHNLVHWHWWSHAKTHRLHHSPSHRCRHRLARC